MFYMTWGTEAVSWPYIKHNFQRQYENGIFYLELRPAQLT